MGGPGKGVMADIAGAIGRGIKSAKEARNLKKLKYSPAATAARVKSAGDPIRAAKEVEDAVKFAKRNRTVKAIIGTGAAAYLGSKAAKKKITVSVSDRAAKPTKKATKKKPAKQGTKRYTF